MAWWGNIAGTALGYFRLGLSGVRIKNDAGALSVRNAGDSAVADAKFGAWLNTDGTENFKCRAWVNFNGTGVVAIRAAGNVSSITDSGTGVYAVNFTAAMPDANYATIATAGATTAGTWTTTTTAGTTTSVSFATFNYLGVLTDTNINSVACFR